MLNFFKLGLLLLLGSLATSPGFSAEASKKKVRRAYCQSLLELTQAHHLRIVPLSAGNVEQVIFFLKDHFSYDGDNAHVKNIPKRFRRVVHYSFRTPYWVLMGNGSQVLGGIGLARLPRNKQSLQWWIDWFAVSPQLQGLGFGKAL